MQLVRVWYHCGALIYFKHFMHYHLEQMSEQLFLVLRLTIQSPTVFVI